MEFRVWITSPYLQIVKITKTCIIQKIPRNNNSEDIMTFHSAEMSLDGLVGNYNDSIRAAIDKHSPLQKLLLWDKTLNGIHNSYTLPKQDKRKVVNSV